MKAHETPPPVPARPNLHRNNAAEWVMFAVVWPVAGVVRMWLWSRRRLGRRRSDD